MIGVRMPGMNNNFWLLVAVPEPVFFLVPNSFLARVAKGNITVNRLPRVEEKGMLDPATARAAGWTLKSTKYKCWMEI